MSKKDYKRLTVQLTDEIHANLLAKVKAANFETIAEYVRASIAEWKPKQRKIMKKVAKKAAKKAVKKVAKKTTKKVTKKAAKKTAKKAPRKPLRVKNRKLLKD